MFVVVSAGLATLTRLMVVLVVMTVIMPVVMGVIVTGLRTAEERGDLHWRKVVAARACSKRPAG